MVATNRPPIIVMAIGPQKMLRASGIMPKMAARAVSTTGRARRTVPHDSGRLPCVMPRGSIRRSVSQLSGDLLDHELPSVERDRVTGALALQLSIDRCLGGDAHDLVAVAHKLACRHGNNEKLSA
jgi:hypothetical protein